jgi:hypothetical protein
MNQKHLTMRHWMLGAALLAAILVSTREACAQAPTPMPSAVPAASEAQGLAKQLSNPVSSLVSVPFQLNFDQGVGPQDDQRFVMNFQPVMPFTVDKSWNVVTRVILPVLSQPSLAPAAGQ